MDEASEKVQVRVAEPEDAAAVDRLILYLDEFHAQGRPELFRVPSQKPRGDRFLLNALEDRKQHILVAISDAEVVGYAHVMLKRTEASGHRIERRYSEIDTIAVIPSAQRLGAGRKLIEAAVDWAESNGVDDHQIAVHDFNLGARRLYEQLGYAPSVTLLRRKG
jgi:ribosomal protein S18 acetylase RimI-like enzyme